MGLASGFWWVRRPNRDYDEVAYWDADNEYWLFVGDPEEYGFRLPPNETLKIIAGATHNT